jgi:hypothetical protein
MSGPKVRKDLQTVRLANPQIFPVAYGASLDSLVVSQGHRLYKGKRSGGPFAVFHCNKRITPGTVRPMLHAGVRYNGGLVVPITGPLFSDAEIRAYFASNATLIPKQSALDALKPYGTTGWARAAPGRPTASVAQTAIELFREGIPSLPGRLAGRLLSARNAGSNYLNYQFGWAPLVNDIKKMYQTYRELDKRLAQLVRDNGKGIRRRRDLGSDSTTTVVSDTSVPGGNGYIIGSPGMYGGIPGRSTSVIYKTESTHRWFVGKFRYYVPDIGSDQWTRRATRALFGLNPTPELLWNVLPWSWMADWFGNVGDVLSNMSSHAVDNLTAEYAYVMEHKTTTTTVDIRCHNDAYVKPPTFQGGYDVPINDFTTTCVDTVETKLRAGASPYGFGLTFDGFSNYQLSILAALGVTRGAKY